LKVDTARPPSPAYGSPIQQLARDIQADEDEEDAAATDEMNVDAQLEAALRRESKGKSKDRDREVEVDAAVESSRPKERKRRRDEENSSGTTTTSNSDNGKKLKDVTNSPRGHSSLPPLDTNSSGMLLHSTSTLIFITIYSLIDYRTCRSRSPRDP
jgi:hypothetical protein